MVEEIFLEEAVKLILQQIDSIDDIVEKKVSGAGGFCLAEDIYAPLDNPPFPRSPIDGYAVRACDIKEATPEHPVRLKVIGCVFAGEDGQMLSVDRGQACRIMTGAPFPQGTDAAVKQEDTDYGENTVSIYRSQGSYDNYCFQGEDYRKGTLLLQKGTRITFAEQGILAGIGRTVVQVYRKPVIRVFTTGDELCMPGIPLAPGKIYDSNGMMVSARLEELGIPPAAVCHQPDREKELADSLKSAAAVSDLIITTGGVSVGKKDILHGALRLMGAEKIFWKVKLQPGMPTIFSVYQGTGILSLSGNPFGAMANLELLLRPVLKKMTGDRTYLMEQRHGVIKADFKKKSRVRRFVRAYYDAGNVYFPQGIHSSGAIGTLRGCNCLLDIPAGTECVKAGERVTVWML